MGQLRWPFFASKAGSRIPPGVPYKLDHRVPQAPRSGLGRRGFDSGAQRRVESLPAYHLISSS